MIDRISMLLCLFALALAAVTGFAPDFVEVGHGRWLMLHTGVAPGLVIVLLIVVFRFAERSTHRLRAILGWIFLASAFATIGSVQLALSSHVAADDQRHWLLVHRWAAGTLVASGLASTIVRWRKPREG